MPYAFEADIYCDDCGKDIQERLKAKGVEDDGTTDTFPQYVSDEQNESDCPQHCGAHDHCMNAIRIGLRTRLIGAFLENPLTTDGVAYTKNCIISDLMNGEENSVAIEIWAPFYELDLNNILLEEIRKMVKIKTGQTDYATAFIRLRALIDCLDKRIINGEDLPKSWR